MRRKLHGDGRMEYLPPASEEVKWDDYLIESQKTKDDLEREQKQEEEKKSQAAKDERLKEEAEAEAERQEAIELLEKDKDNKKVHELFNLILTKPKFNGYEDPSQLPKCV